MGKRYYTKGEFVWIKELKRKGKVKELFISELSATVEYFDDNGDKQSKKLTFMEIDKFKRNETETVSKGSARKDTILFAKTRSDAVIPSKRNEDGGYDIYASLEGIREVFGNDFVVIEPRQVVLIPTGLASSLLPKYRFVLKERGSTGTRAMSVRAGIIDSGFRKEWFVAINNTGSKMIVLSPLAKDVVEYEDRIDYPINKAIAQALLDFVPDVNKKEISYEDLLKIPSERGQGELGSSGK